MKSLLKNYVEKLTLDKFIEFGKSNEINLNTEEYKFILDLVQSNFDDLLQNEDKYLKLIEEKISPKELEKIKDLITEYKQKYKGYLF